MTLNPAGYTLLLQRHKIETLPHFVTSFVGETGRHTIIESGIRRELYPRVYWPGETDLDHLEFALKYEGLNLPLLRSLLPRLSPGELNSWIQSKPTAANTRRLWFLFEQ